MINRENQILSLLSFDRQSLCPWLERRICSLVFLGVLISPEIFSKEAIGAEVDEEDSLKVGAFFSYRFAGLKRRDNSVFHDEAHKDYVDQMYLAPNFKMTSGFDHLVLLEPAFYNERDDPNDLLFRLDQAYIDTSLGPKISLTAGKKVEYRGSGFATNPSDLLNENKDFFDSLEQRQGSEFTRLSFSIVDSTLTLGFIPKVAQNFNDGKLWLTLAGEYFRSDVLLAYTHHKTEKSTTGFSLSRFVADSLELHVDARYQSRQRAPEEQDERRYSRFLQEDPSGYYLVGSRVIFSNRRTLILEGIANESGLADEELAAFHDAKKLRRDSGKVQRPPVRIIGKRYGFLSYQDSDSIAALSTAFSILHNLDDRSSFIYLSLKYQISNLTNIELVPTYFKGKLGQEFGEMPIEDAYYLVLRGRI
jgi:hypothetical protein